MQMQPKTRLPEMSRKRMRRWLRLLQALMRAMRYTPALLSGHSNAQHLPVLSL